MSHLLVPILAFTAAAGVLTLTPGLDTAMILRTATSGGARKGVAAALGISLGLFAWGVGAAFGLTALLMTSKLAFLVVKWVGAAYLLYLGVKLLAKPRKALAMEAVEVGARPQPNAFQRGFLSNILNPKVGVFYITFLPQFIPPGMNVAAFSILLTSIHVVLGLAWSAVLISLTVPLGRFLQTPRVVRALDRLTGCVFVGFGLKLALTEHA
jgi:threonine/homoserine/homoserine lactone efflux protein